MKIADRVFVVTGAGNGIGRQVVLGLVRQAARVAAVDYDEQGLIETERLARTTRGTVSTHTVNVTDRDAVAALIPFSGQICYGASKGAVKQFSEGLYAELLDTNVRVVTLFPGNISTNLAGNSGVQMIDAGGRKVRATTPEVAGDMIVDGIAKDSFRVVIGNDARLLNALSWISTRRTTRFVAKQMKSVL